MDKKICDMYSSGLVVLSHKSILSSYEGDKKSVIKVILRLSVWIDTKPIQISVERKSFYLNFFNKYYGEKILFACRKFIIPTTMDEVFFKFLHCRGIVKFKKSYFSTNINSNRSITDNNFQTLSLKLRIKATVIFQKPLGRDVDDFWRTKNLGTQDQRHETRV